MTANQKSQKAVVCHGAVDLRVEDRDIPAPKPDEVQIKVAMTGLCGSDLHYYLHGANGTFKIRDPLVLGHESCGIVSAVGSNVNAGFNLKVGDRVAMEVGVYCKTCKMCRQGRYNLCANMRFASSAKTYPHLDGTLREVMNWPAELVYKLPPGLELPLAALAEPLSVVLHAYRRAHLSPGARILVIGTGAVGLLTCALARASGCTSVVAVDIEQGKLDFAAQQGWTTSTFCLPRGPRVSGVEALEAAGKAWEALKASDAVQSVEGLEDGFDAAAAIGTKVLFVGMGTKVLALPCGPSLLSEVDLIGVFRYCNTYPDALALLASGKLGDVSKMASHYYSLDQAVEAFEDLKRGRDKDGRTVIKPMVGNLELCGIKQ
ncbi:xylitol dehydrogenase [Cryptococcus deuterogattii 99/473]|uniref:Xylitol dehydrogenase n=1 Tax=Cryptococcus deuterogattii Ram5 TaxID=1296110 RepID=A0A0D0VDZ3_9TREE|nr:xylitol dehydrogenase [Cryptococcus deuterogattii LA55]KIR35986.1 xylitol dehydrogenase [Cryptococcus deuterogattii MMRL2647]KIR43055.1 xylitol dehydrogenase [Cryptococcus deuterogattii Ram5]KIR75419.1 xylitol dehydrogenase [Cryptococcus deuterogattii CA1014]KIR95360.1 xylitol dehydrogenase [Cryptococcus deuterogattii CBS 10090]KIS01855.1 xylitol dehydrogenase [Cryptococcus deuterogattii 2001/935-1]KIY56391.1 xylitol dehydrogenase [Cryptococcus deuterogattii 99/473]